MFDEIVEPSTKKEKVVVPPGVYQLRCSGIGEYSGVGAKGPYTCWSFNFVFVGPAKYVNKFAPGYFVAKGWKIGNKLDKTFKIISGKTYPEGTRPKEEDVKGRRVDAMITVYKDKNGDEKNKIVELLPVETQEVSTGIITETKVDIPTPIKEVPEEYSSLVKSSSEKKSEEKPITKPDTTSKDDLDF